MIKYSIYLREPISKEKIAGTKRHFETHASKANAKLKINMDRLTNLSYNSLAGFEIPKSLSVRNYVVFLSLDRLKEPIANSRNKKGSPKLIRRRKRTEFAMTRNLKEWGLRRVNNTNNSLVGKGPSYVRLNEKVLSGIYESNQLDILKSYIVGNQKCLNLSIIMADPNFLIAAWVRIKSNKSSLLPALIPIILDGINLEWFKKIANEMRSGEYLFISSIKKYVSKPDEKKRPLTMPSPRDKIVQEGMRFLLSFIFEGVFNKNSHNWIIDRGCYTALNQIKMNFAQDNWYIEGDIDSQSPFLNHSILVEHLKTKINDQVFIDLIYKYLRMGYEISFKDVIPMKLGVIHCGLVSPILVNIYMIPFDHWVETYLIPKYTKGKHKRANPIYAKMIKNGKVTYYSIPSMLFNDKNYSRLHYVRYADTFIMGLNRSKDYCKQIILECKTFLLKKLKLTLNFKKIKTTCSQIDSALFLGYRLYKTKLNKNKTAFNTKGVKTSRVTNTVCDAPINIIIQKLIQQNYAKPNGRPTRNETFFNYTLYHIIEHYKMVEKSILQYYSLANNYRRVVARVHYILKYSCALTIASKMKLKTLRKVFNKYGKAIVIKNQNKKIKTKYLTVKYKRLKKNSLTSIFYCTNLE